MNFIKAHIDKVVLAMVILLILGILSAYINLGAVSVVASVVLPILFLLNIIVACYAVLKKKYRYLIGLIAFLFCFKFFFQWSTESEHTEATLSLLTYNVKAFADEDQQVANNIIKFIDSINPDILLLQESTYKVGRRISGFNYHFLGFREGVEKTLLDIYSKFPIVNKGFVDFPESKNNSIYADLKVKNDTLRIYNIHLQSFAFTSSNADGVTVKASKTLSKQIEQASLIKAHTKQSKHKVIVSGDLNATQFTKPYRIISEELNDSFFKKGRYLGTTYSLKGYPLRLDYALVDKSLSIHKHENIELNLSDHQPLLIKFSIPKISRS